VIKQQLCHFIAVDSMPIYQGFKDKKFPNYRLACYLNMKLEGHFENIVEYTKCFFCLNGLHNLSSNTCYKNWQKACG
tara:strand:- start:461 stop:691 length:231 start_codon:yes stop_codon:yes gene_type:complete